MSTSKLVGKGNGLIEDQGSNLDTNNYIYAIF
jgi:hypothetical protein